MVGGVAGKFGGMAGTYVLGRVALWYDSVRYSRNGRKIKSLELASRFYDTLEYVFGDRTNSNRYVYKALEDD